MAALHLLTTEQVTEAQSILDVADADAKVQFPHQAEVLAAQALDKVP